MSAIKILDRKTLGPSKYKLENVTYEMTGTDGKQVQKQAEVYHRPSGAAVLLYDLERKKLMFTKQLRLPTYFNGNESGKIIEVCAGLTDEGETVEETAIREVKEELGYQLKTVKKVASVYLSPGADIEISHLYIAEYQPEMKIGNGGGMPDEKENITVLELDFANARERLQCGEFRDAKTMILVQYFFMNQAEL